MLFIRVDINCSRVRDKCDVNGYEGMDDLSCKLVDGENSPTTNI